MCHVSLRFSALNVLASEIYQPLVVGIQIARFEFLKVTNWTFKGRLKTLPMDDGEQRLSNRRKSRKVLCANCMSW